MRNRQTLTDFKDHSNAFRGEGDLRGINKQGLHDLHGPHVRYHSLSHIDACRGYPSSMAIAQLSHHLDRVDASVLSESVRYDFEGLSIKVKRIIVSVSRCNCSKDSMK